MNKFFENPIKPFAPICIKMCSPSYIKNDDRKNKADFYKA